jgi:hypothetical protein
VNENRLRSGEIMEATSAAAENNQEIETLKAIPKTFILEGCVNPTRTDTIICEHVNINDDVARIAD